MSKPQYTSLIFIGLFGVVLAFHLKPAVAARAESSEVLSHEEAPLIRKIRVKGHYPFLTKRILRLLSLQSGDPYRAENILENEMRLKEFFEKRGRYGTTIRIETKNDKKPGFVNLVVHVKKGKTHHLGDVDFEGNTFFSDSVLKNRLFSFTHFSLKKIEKKLKKIQKSYSENGFVRARVHLVSVQFNPETRRMDVKVEIDENRRLKLKFVGNRWFKPQTLDDYVTFYKERGYSRFEIERSEEKLRQFYITNGFPEISLYSEVYKTPEEVTIRMTLNEGPRTRTKKIRFSGNQNVRPKKLKKAMLLKEHTLSRQGLYRAEALPEDIEGLKNYYRDHGFFDAEIISSSVEKNRFGDLVTVHVEVDEGEPYFLSSVSINGADHFKQADLLKKSDLKLKRNFDRSRVIQAGEKIRSAYLKEGFPYVRIESREDIKAHDHSVDLIIDLVEGPRAFFGQIQIEGEYETNEKMILNTLKFKERDVYTYDKMLTAQLNLKRLGIFDYVLVTPVGLSDENAIVDVIVKVVERKNTTLDLQAGFDSDKLASGQIVFTKRNLFGLAKQIQLKGIGGFEFDRGEITFYSPRVMGASWNLANQYFVQYEDDENFNASSFGGSIGVLKNFGPDWTLLMKNQITRFDIFEGESNQEALDENLFDSVFSELVFSASYDNRDNYADPQRGFYALLTTEFDTDAADISNNFNRTQFSITHYLGFLDRLTLVNTARFRKIFEISSNPRIPAQKLFFMGGNDTVRGFDEDAIDSSGGKTSIIYNAELQYRLFGDVKLAGFFDAGSLTESFRDISNESFRESAGIGLRYVTPVGPIRLDYGFVLDKKPDEKGQRLHFSFGYFF